MSDACHQAHMVWRWMTVLVWFFISCTSSVPATPQNMPQAIVETIHACDVGASEYYSAYFSEGYLWVLISTPQPNIVQIVP